MIVLMILDGWGYSPNQPYNAIAQARTPQWNEWWRSAPKALLACSGDAVGLPPGQMGNSEVGHMHIGAGRILEQDYTRINQAIADGSFCHNEALLYALQDTAREDKAIHILGLLSPGGVHSHEDHIHALIQCLQQQENSPKVYLHLFLDGRDTPPRSAKASLEKLEALLAKNAQVEIKSVSGRYYAMDRDERWDRIQRTYEVLTEGTAAFYADTALDALDKAYHRGENDEFVQPTCIGSPKPIQAGDTVFFMNYRADRARQLSRALICVDFAGFQRNVFPSIGKFVTLTHYANDIPSIALFPPLMPQQTLGECVADRGLKQLRVAETEKYAHVTFFLNGGRELPFTNEDRVLIPSPKVATYDMQPEMSAMAIKDCIVKAIMSQSHDLVIANFANADMVGHTGDMAATIRAIECLDSCFAEINAAAKKMAVEIVITADHGNAECMFDEKTHQTHTAHTSEPVPFLYIGRPVKKIEPQGSLIDIAPTILSLLNLSIPPEMKGKPLVQVAE